MILTPEQTKKSIPAAITKLCSLSAEDLTKNLGISKPNIKYLSYLSFLSKREQI